MPKYIALLRAINVGGHNVKMQQLRALFEELGFTGVETFIASGNVIFATVDEDVAVLTERIERHLRQALGYEVATFLRAPGEIAAVARYQPFSEAALALAGALNVAFLYEPLSEAAQQSLPAFTTEIDEFHTAGRELYWLCRVKQSDSTFSNAKFEKALRIKATFRGINTVRRLAAKYPA